MRCGSPSASPGALILVGAATTSFSGITRLTHSLAGHGSLPRRFARLERRALVSSEAIAIAAALAIGLIVMTELAAGGDPGFLAAIYSFGVLIAFTAAQLAVIRLRVSEPGLLRPFRARPDVRIRGHAVPLPALVGAPLTFVVWVLALATHDGARYAGPAWLAVGPRALRARAPLGAARAPGAGRAGRGAARRRRVRAHPRPAEARRHRRGDGGDGDRAREGAVPGDRGDHGRPGAGRYPLEGPLPPDVAARVDASLEEARALGEEHGVDVRTDVVRARSIGHAIVHEAQARDVDLVVIGSSARWRRQSRFFSPTVDFVLRQAPCEVLVVAFPEGVFQE